METEAEHKPTELSDILSGNSSETPAAPPPADPAPQPSAEAAPPSEAAERTRVPKGEPGAGQFAKKDENTGGEAAAAAADPSASAAPAPDPQPAGSPPPDEAPQVPRAALMGERQRRQEAEDRIRFLEQHIQSLQRLPQAPPASEAPKIDFWDDPEAALAARFDQFGQTILDRIEERQFTQQVNRSEALARSKYEDFDDALTAFQNAAMNNPALAREASASDDPAEFAYRKGKSLAQLHSHGGDIEALLAAERAKWETELRERAPSPTPTPSLPPSTASERSMGVPRAGPEWAGPKSLNEILRS